MLRSMKNSFEGKVFYESTFDTETGVLTRVVEAKPPGRRYEYSDLLEWLFPEKNRTDKDEASAEKREDRFRELFGQRRRPFSPVPETLDISITDWCNYGCPNCYMSSTTDRSAAPVDLVSKVLLSFDSTPYQIAIGGG